VPLRCVTPTAIACRNTPAGAVVESTVRSLKHGLPESKLPVGGPIPARTMLCPAALMANLRCLHSYLPVKVEKGSQMTAGFHLTGLKSTL